MKVKFIVYWTHLGGESNYSMWDAVEMHSVVSHMEYHNSEEESHFRTLFFFNKKVLQLVKMNFWMSDAVKVRFILGLPWVTKISNVSVYLLYSALFIYVGDILRLVTLLQGLRQCDWYWLMFTPGRCCGVHHAISFSQEI